MPNHETRNTLMNNLGSKNSLFIEIWPIYVMLQNKFFYLKSLRRNYESKRIQRILCRKDSVEVSMLIWTNFDRFAITYLM